MSYSAKDFRSMAREALRGKWGMAILVTVVAVILGAVPLESAWEIELETGTGVVFKLPWYTYTLVKEGILSLAFSIFVIAWAVVQLVLGGAMTLGYAQFHLNLVRGEEVQTATLFAHKDKLWHGFCITFLKNLYTTLWTLCLVIPGIMAVYSYAMTSFIANDHPELTANQVIAASKEMMQGNRWRLFCMEISFIGWILLTAFTLGIGTFALAPYQEAARACFYKDLSRQDAERSAVITDENIGE